MALEDPGARVRDLVVQLQAAKERLLTSKSRYEAGQITSDLYQEARTAVARLEIALEEARKAEQRQIQRARLLQPVDVEMKNATLSQAAQSLSKAGNLPVHVDPAEMSNRDARITLSARRAQLRAVLEALAKNLEMRIDPSSDGGVELHPWPEVEVNGQKQIFADPTPWSPAWGNTPVETGFQPLATPTANNLATVAGQVVQGASARGAQSNQTQNTVSNNLRNSVAGQQATNGLTLNSGQYRFAPSGLLQGVSLAAAGNAVIVAEPGRGPRGEPGAWLTVYLLDGLALVRKSATFHPTRALLITPTDVQQGQLANPAGVQPQVATPATRNRK
jgi:hypothetical protein